mgnify:CR=1 FL=1
MRPTSDPDHDVSDTARDTPRDAVHPEANVPSPSPWAEVPGQREPDHDGQLYVAAAHDDTDVTPDEAARHEPVPVDESGEPTDRADDARDEARHHETDDGTDDEHSAHDEAAEAHDEAAHAHDEAAHAHAEAAHAHDESTGPDESAPDESAPDESAHDEPAHDEPGHHELTHDESARDEPAHDDESARDESSRLEPVAVGATPLAPGPFAAAGVGAVPVAVPVDTVRDEPAPPVAAHAETDEKAEPDAEPAPDGAAAELKPGDVPVAPVTAFLADTVAQDLRQRWREAQLGFVDDPQKAADDVRNLVNEAIDAVTAALSSQRDTIGGTTGGDTEHFRVTVQRCRALFDRLLNL